MAEQAHGSRLARGGRARNPQGSGERLRAELIDAASRLLADSGDEASLTLRAVAREAGVAAPSVYLQFANKDDLLWAVATTHFETLRAAIVAARDTEPATAPVARLRAACLAYCQFGLDHPAGYRVLFQTIRRQSATHLTADFVGRPAFMVLVEGLAACGAAGAAPRRDPVRAATVVWAGLHGIVSLRLSLPAFPAWPPVPAMVDDLLAGLVGIPWPALAALAAAELVTPPPIPGSDDPAAGIA